jgi:hypothetical protein
MYLSSYFLSQQEYKFVNMEDKYFSNTSSAVLLPYWSSEDEMGGACSTKGSDEKCIQDFGWKMFWEETTWIM